MSSNFRFAITACYAAMAILAIAMNLVSVCLPLLSSGIGSSGPLDMEQLGRIAAVMFIGVVGSLLVAGPLANRYSAKWFTVGGCLLISIGLACLGCSRSYGEVLVAVAILGIGGGILDMILSPVVCALQPDRRTIAMNLLHSFYCVGSVLTILVATLTLGAGIDWHTLALGLALLPMLIGLLFLFIPLPKLVTEEKERYRVRDLLSQRFFLLILAAIFFGGATEVGTTQWLPALAELDLKFSTNVGGTSLLAFSVAMALGRMVIGFLPKDIPMKRIMEFACVATAALLLLAGLCPVPVVALGAAILSGFTGSCLWPSTLGLASDRYPRAGASMFGLLSAIGNVGGIFMPWSVGLVADRSSIAVGLAASAGAPVLMLIALRLL
jgi:fucose permease